MNKINTNMCIFIASYSRDSTIHRQSTVGTTRPAQPVAVQRVVCLYPRRTPARPTDLQSAVSTARSGINGALHLPYSNLKAINHAPAWKTTARFSLNIQGDDQAVSRRAKVWFTRSLHDDLHAE